MPVALLMPALSPTMTEGNIAKWIKKVGDEVVSGDIIAEVETDKATMEVEAIDEGKLASIIYPDGSENVQVNKLIGVIAVEGDTEKDIEDFEEDVLGETPPNTADAMKRHKAGKAGFGDITHLKAKGLIPRSDGKKKVSDKYK